MNTLIIDFETTGVNVYEDFIIEIGAQLVTDDWQVVGEFNALIKNPSSPIVSDEITKITGITQADIDTRGVPLAEAVELLLAVAGEPDIICAYNAEFDEVIFRTEMARNALVPTALLNNPWACAMKDLESNYEKKCWKLSHLALDYGVAVDPAKLHRAIGDVDLTRQMLIKSKASPVEMMNFKRTPWIVVNALIPAPWTDGGKGKLEATKLGYSWETPKGTQEKYEKQWVKRIKAHKLEDEIKNAPFKIRQIGV